MQKFISTTIIAFILALPLLTACTDDAKAREVLQRQGFTDVRPTGYVWFACSEDDGLHTGFRAKNAQGQEVEGVVCCGLFAKACTVRW